MAPSRIPTNRQCMRGNVSEFETCVRTGRKVGCSRCSRDAVRTASWIRGGRAIRWGGIQSRDCGWAGQSRQCAALGTVRSAAARTAGPSPCGGRGEPGRMGPPGACRQFAHARRRTLRGRSLGAIRVSRPVAARPRLACAYSPPHLEGRAVGDCRESGPLTHPIQRIAGPFRLEPLAARSARRGNHSALACPGAGGVLCAPQEKGEAESRLPLCWRGPAGGPASFKPRARPAASRSWSDRPRTIRSVHCGRCCPYLGLPAPGRCRRRRAGRRRWSRRTSP